MSVSVSLISRECRTNPSATYVPTPIIAPQAHAINGGASNGVQALTAPIMPRVPTDAWRKERVNDVQGKDPSLKVYTPIAKESDAIAPILDARASPTCPWAATVGAKLATLD